MDLGRRALPSPQPAGVAHGLRGGALRGRRLQPGVQLISIAIATAVMISLDELTILILMRLVALLR